MRCRNIKKILSEHLEEAIPAVEEHLKACLSAKRDGRD
jgi:hypothetical protein